MYSLGEVVAQDYAEAMKWYLKAADQGHAGAQGLMGMTYYQGEGVPRDYAEAMKWLRLAAAQGDNGAIVFLRANRLTW